MTEHNHTPGPWPVRQPHPEEYPEHYWIGPGWHADGTYMAVSGPIGRANANLIAAAPETAAERDRLATELQHCLCAHEAANSALAAARAELDRLRALNAELLAALEAVVDCHAALTRHVGHSDDTAVCLVTARAAIAKAKGGAA